MTSFDCYLARQARTEGTRRKYRESINHYTGWLTDQPPGTVTTAEIDRYLDHWRDRFHTRHGRPPATASYRAQINALRAFYSYLDRISLITNHQGQPAPDPMRNITHPAPPPPATTGSDPPKTTPSSPATAASKNAS